MNRPHIHAHAQVVEALSGHAPRHQPQAMYQEGHASQINPRRNPRNNFRDRSNRRKTTGFEEIRQEYYQIHQNKATAEPAETHNVPVHRAQADDDPQEFFPKPSAFLRTPRRQVPSRRPKPMEMDTTELLDGGGFTTRGSKAANMFQRRRERTDQFILDQDNAIPPPPPSQQVTPQSRPTIQLTQSPWDAAIAHPAGRPDNAFQTKPVAHHQPNQQPRMQAYAPVQSRHAPPQQQMARPQQQRQQHHQQQQQNHQQQQHHQQQQQQHQYKQQQHHQQQQAHHQQPRQQSRGHTTVDSRRTRQPLTPKSPRFELNSPWKDRNMQVGKRFHPNVIPYQDNYNTTPRGWGKSFSDFGDDNNVKHHYEFTDTSEKFKFTPAPRINKFGSGIKTPGKENYNSRPKSWCDIELTASHQAPPMRRAYPSAQRQHSESSVNQFAGHHVGWGYGESDEL